jgi:hypothetical protein
VRRFTRPTVLLLALTTIAWIALLTLWALVTPAFGTHGEVDGVDAVFRTALGAGWPAPGQMHALASTRWLSENPADRSTVAAVLAAHPGETTIVNPLSQHPQTFFLAAGAVLRIAHWESLRWDHAVLLIRLVDVVLLAPLPLLVAGTARRLVGSPRVAVVAPLLLFAVPKAAQFGASVTLWAPLVLIAAIVTWLAARVLTGDRSWWTSVGLAVAAACGATINAMGLLLVVFALTIVLVARHDLRWSETLVRRAIDAVVVIVPAAIVGAVFWRSLRAGWVPDAAPQPDPIPPASPTGMNPGDFLNGQWNGGTATFWGGLGDDAFRFTPPLVAGLTVIGLGVLFWAAVRADRALRPTWGVLLWPALVVAAVLGYEWRNALADNQIATSSGRFLLVAVPALVAGFAAAAASLLPSTRARRTTALVGGVGALLIAAYGLLIGFSGAYQAGRVGLTGAGIAALAGSTPLGWQVLAAVAALLGAASVAAVVALVLVVAARSTPPPLPLDSPPTVEPTQRNNP